MDASVLDCDPIDIDRGLCVCKGVPSLGILKDVQKAYEERIELIHKAGGRNKLQKELELLRLWVRDLVEQNGMLARTVEEMEAEVSSRMVLEKRRNSEIESELRTEVSALRRRLARKDSDLRGLLELLRRLRDFDHRDIGDIRFYERDQKKTICDKVNELKVLNDSLQKENYMKEREIRKLASDIQQYEQMLANLKNVKSTSRDVPTKDEEVMTEACTSTIECGNVAPAQDNSSAWKDSTRNQERMLQLEEKLKVSMDAHRALRKEGVALREDLRTLGQMCGALYEQQQAAALRLQFKDEIIREMRRQLRQAKAKIEATNPNKPSQKTVPRDRDAINNSAISYDAMMACVRKQPRRKRRLRTEMDDINIQWECQSTVDASAEETVSIKVD